MKTTDKINFKSTNKGITIFISKSLLKHVATHHPDGITVTNAQELQDKVAFELEHNLGPSESGLSGFQQLIDEAISEAAEWEAGCEFAESPF